MLGTIGAGDCKLALILDGTLKINLKNPTVAFDVTLFDRAGYQISPTAWEQYGKDNFGQHAVGTGPFKLVELLPGERCHLRTEPGLLGESDAIP